MSDYIKSCIKILENEFPNEIVENQVKHLSVNLTQLAGELSA